MKRSLAVVVVVLATGCVHRHAAPVAVDPPMVVAEPEELTPTADAVAEVEEALKGVTVRFAYDQDLLDYEAMLSLQKVAPVLRRNGAVKLQIAGHCDERGTEEYNLLLGQRRAESARSYLSALGVTEAQLDTISYGADRPVVAEHSEEAWAVNRRDDVAVKQPDLHASGELP